MSTAAKDLMDHGKPWRAEAKWEIVAAEAVILLALGAFMLINTSGAGNAILQIIGLVFLIVSLQVAIGSFRDVENGLGVFDSFRAGIGVTVGVIATSLWWSNSVPNDAVRLILGCGLIAYPLLQLIGAVMVRGRGALRPLPLIMSGLALALGIMLLTSNSESATDRITFLGIVFLVFGALLGGFAYLLRNRGAEAA